MLGWDTEDILRRRFPHGESESLDFKAKPVIEGKAKRLELVKHLSAMANTYGGTILVGVRETDEGGMQLANFPDGSEAKQKLIPVAREFTVPPISYHLDVTFEEVEYRRRIMRIDVEDVPAGSEIKFAPGDPEEADYYIRDGDSTRRMTKDEFRQRVALARRTEATGSTPFRVRARLEDYRPSSSSPPPLDRPDHRVILRKGNLDHILFGRGPDPVYGGPLQIYQARANWSIRGDRTFDELIRHAAEFLDLCLGWEFSYGISQGTRQWHGRPANLFLHDVPDHERIIDSILGGHPSEVPDEITHVDNHRPTITAAGPCRYGLFWVQTYKGVGYCGVLVPHIPVADDGLKSFFRWLNADYAVYEQHPGTQRFSLGRVVPLRDWRMTNPVPDEPLQLGLLAANPFHGRSEELRRAFGEHGEDFLVQKLCEALARLDHLPVMCMGGEPSEGDVARLHEFEVAYVHMHGDVFVVRAWCRG